MGTGGILPIFPIKLSDLWGQFARVIEAQEMDAPTIGMRARLIEAFDPTCFTEQMFGLTAPKPIENQVFCAIEHCETIMRDKQV